MKNPPEPYKSGKFENADVWYCCHTSQKRKIVNPKAILSVYIILLKQSNILNSYSNKITLFISFQVVYSVYDKLANKVKTDYIDLLVFHLTKTKHLSTYTQHVQRSLLLFIILKQSQFQLQMRFYTVLPYKVQGFGARPCAAKTTKMTNRLNKV